MKSIYLLLILGLAASCFCGIESGPILSSEAPHEAFAINFKTGSACAGEVGYRIEGSSTWLFESETAPVSEHHIFLPVYPAADYEYFVRADGDSAGPFSFRTAPLPGDYVDFNFCAYGDTRTGLLAHHTVVDHIVGCDPMFVVHSGDIVDDGHDTGQWDTYFQELSEWHNIAQTASYFYAMGNHDDESPYFYDAVELPKNNPDSTEAYSSFDYGRIHFFSMNSEIAHDPASPQYAFLEADLAEASANPDYDFLIGLVHRPFYSSGYHGREEDLAADLEPLLIANGVDLVLQGHDHMYERIYPQEGVNYIVTGGGGAPPSPIFIWFDWTAFGYNLYHHLDCHYDATESKLSIYMHNYDDDVVDSLILEGTPVSVAETELPETKGIRAYPNPFNSACRIECPAEVGVYNLRGKLVKTLPAGASTWSPIEDTPSGIYLLKTPEDRRSASVVFLK